MSAAVWAGMATLLERSRSRPDAIESLLGQVDRLSITPGEHLGARAKFCSAESAPGYFFCVDDDLVYPPDYVSRTLAGLARHPGAIVGYLGYMVTEEATRGDSCPRTHAFEPVDEDQRVDIICTCLCAFHVATIRPLLADFPTPNAADVWLSVLAERLGVPRIVLAHEGDYFGYIPPERTMADETRARTGSSLDASSSFSVGLREFVTVRSAA